jgi:hypothetical protein
MPFSVMKRNQNVAIVPSEISLAYIRPSLQKQGFHHHFQAHAVPIHLEMLRHLASKTPKMLRHGSSSLAPSQQSQRLPETSR